MRLLLASLFTLPLLAAPPPIPTSLDIAASSSFNGSVNIVSGSYYESCSDLVVKGAEPIIIYRTHLSRDLEHHPGSWRFHDERISVYAAGAKPEGGDTEWVHQIFLKEASGGVVEFNPEVDCGYHKKDPITWAAWPIINKGYGNIGNGPISGKTHRANYRLRFDQATYCFTLTTGSGEKRIYSLKGNYPSHKECIRYSSGFWSDFFDPEHSWSNELEFVLKEVIKPSGNRILYSYDNNGRLAKIEAYDATKKDQLTWVEFSYLNPSGDEVSAVTTSDNQRVDYHYDVKRGLASKPRRQFILTGVTVNSLDHMSYDHSQHRIINRTSSGGEYLRTTYLHEGGNAIRKHSQKAFQVGGQWAPVGKNGKEKQVSSFAYFTKRKCDGYTDAWDANEHRNRYHYSEAGKVYLIEHFQKEEVGEKRCRFEWLDWQGSRLKRWCICDDKGIAFLRKDFAYDNRYNVIEEKNYGALSGSRQTSNLIYPYYSYYSWYTKKQNYHYRLGNQFVGAPEVYSKAYTYSQDGFNNLLTETYDATKVVYTYWEGTDLLKTKSTYEQEQLRLTESYEYNESASLTLYKKSDEYRTFIKKISYRPEEPGFGLPEWIEEFALDEEKEVLIRREHLHYSDRYEVIARDIYDAAGKMRYTLYFEYDPMGRLIKSTNANGEAVCCAYDQGGHLIERVTPASTTHIQYDPAGRPIQTEVTDDSSACKTFKQSYDSAGHVISQTDPFGETTRFHIDRYGRPITTLHPAVKSEATYKNPTTHSTYDAWGNLTSQADENGQVTTYQYQGRNQLILTHYPNGSCEIFHYFLNGQLEAHIDEAKLTTRYTRDYLGRPLTIKVYADTGELLKETEHTYEGAFLVATRHPDGATTFYTYNFSGQLIEEDHEGKKVLYEYDLLQRLSQKQICDDEGTTIYRYAYDLLNRALKEEVLDGEENLLFWKGWEYDFEGRVILELNEGSATQTRYSLHGPISIVDPNGDETTITYGTHPRKQIVTDPLGLSTFTTYNSRGAVESVEKKSATQDLASSTSYRYDLAGYKTHEIHTPIHNGVMSAPYIVEWTYDVMGRPLTLTEGGSDKRRTTTYSYDLAGRLISTCKPSGVMLHRTYDPLGRLATFSGDDFFETYTYDSADRLLFAHSHNGTTSRSYNKRGDLISETLETGLTLNYTRSLHGKPTQVTLPDDSSFSYTYQGSQIACFTRGGHKVRYQYNLSGKLIQVDSPIQSTSLSYDPKGRLTTLKNSDFHQKAAYDPVGNLTELFTSDPFSTSTSTYAYDSLYQLTCESETLSAFTSTFPHNALGLGSYKAEDFSTTYQYDSLHNRLEKGGESYSHDPFNQLTQAGDTPFLYNKDGEVTQMGSHSHIYDNRGRLISIELENLKVDYTYDPFHRRLSETRYTKSLGNWYSTAHIKFLYVNQQEIGALNGEGELITFRPPAPGPGGQLASIPLLELKGIPYFPTLDFRGSIALLNSKKGVEEIYHYDAFGNARIFDWLGFPQSSSQNPYQFLTKYVDEETQLIFFGRRYYSPDFGRWLTPDPRGFDDGPNLYAYCRNCPMTLIDLLGLLSQDKDTERSSLKEKVASIIQTGKDWKSRSNVYTATEGNFDRAITCNFSLQSESTVLNLGLKPLPDGTSIHFQNGINTPKEAALAAMERLSNNCDGYNVICEYNPTQGIAADIGRVSMELYFGLATKAVEVCKESILSDWNQSSKLGGILSFSHSAGTTVHRNAEMLMPQEDREHIYPVCLAPSAYIRKDLNPNAWHYASKRDIVPLLDAKGRAMCKETTTWLDPSNGADPFDHGIMSPTYDQPIRDAFKEHMERLKKWGFDG